ncbi:hypothetical protein GA0116948_10735 [Chitinophaga costaii]|uniref:Modulator of drug activity B n=1 Tax=Chitinophaga costaii TaxID=1335309 RepID=A0A1C4E236_9BACT|nr:hypothetical protein [Chitinophaga costaii]PUZ24366.1 hypothetical protein DCM91_13140 [Chitinophaga costaii]SCC37575.1 hypothetical protein GA0116948_10735 [Chitinophaga costaii]
MTKVFIINGGQVFDESKGLFNKTLTNWTENFMVENGFEVRVTNASDDFDTQQEIENFTWADVIVWHTKPLMNHFLNQRRNTSHHDLRKDNAMAPTPII